MLFFIWEHMPCLLQQFMRYYNPESLSWEVQSLQPLTLQVSEYILDTSYAVNRDQTTLCAYTARKPFYPLHNLSIGVIYRCHYKVNEQEHKTSPIKDLNQCKRSGSQNSFLLHIDMQMHCHSTAGQRQSRGDGQHRPSLPATASSADLAPSFGWGDCFPAQCSFGAVPKFDSGQSGTMSIAETHSGLAPGGSQKGEWTGDILCILQLEWGRRVPGWGTRCFVFFLHWWVTLGVIVQTDLTYLHSKMHVPCQI